MRKIEVRTYKVPPIQKNGLLYGFEPLCPSQLRDKSGFIELRMALKVTDDYNLVLGRLPDSRLAIIKYQAQGVLVAVESVPRPRLTAHVVWNRPPFTDEEGKAIVDFLYGVIDHAEFRRRFFRDAKDKP